MEVGATGVVVVVLATAVDVIVCVVVDAVAVTNVVDFTIFEEKQEHTWDATADPRLDICACTLQLEVVVLALLELEVDLEEFVVVGVAEAARLF